MKMQNKLRLKQFRGQSEFKTVGIKVKMYEWQTPS